MLLLVKTGWADLDRSCHSWILPSFPSAETLICVSSLADSRQLFLKFVAMLLSLKHLYFLRMLRQILHSEVT